MSRAVGVALAVTISKVLREACCGLRGPGAAWHLDNLNRSLAPRPSPEDSDFGFRVFFWACGVWS